MESLITHLRNPAAYPHSCSSIEVVETHISWVVLTGSRAYKIKKPVSLGFVDFSSIELRRHFCEEEVRLNSRLAPDLYDGVVPITEAADGVAVGGDGRVLEYAVCMRQFDRANSLSRVPLARVTLEQWEQLADDLADFHRSAPAADDGKCGTPDLVIEQIEENFQVLEQIPGVCRTITRDLQERTKIHFLRLRPILERRAATGCIRECHGDLHLSNMFLNEDRITVFDGIDFNESLRWIDPASDLAFLVMDLHDHGHPDLASRVLNRWLERTGDYEALHVLPFYCAYRAAVRAKVDVIRLHQPEVSCSDQRHLANECQRYLELAKQFLTRTVPVLRITVGPSGSGKTTVAQQMIDQEHYIRIRSDIERKRMFDLPVDAGCREDSKLRLYSSEASRNVYRRLHELAACVLDAGYSVIVDATFLQQSQRRQFQRLAECLGVPFRIVACSAEPSVLRNRIRIRQQEGTDASDADVGVLDRQLEVMEPLNAEERSLCTSCVSD